jgi:hypothetical protein
MEILKTIFVTYASHQNSYFSIAFLKEETGKAEAPAKSIHERETEIYSNGTN